MRPVPRLYDVCRAFLVAIAEWYVENDIAIPDRQHVSAGAPPWDCELFSVWTERTYSHQGNIGSEITEPLIGAAGSALRAVVMGITIVRCSPQNIVLDDGHTIVWPTVDEEQQAAALVMVDEVAVENAIRDQSRAGLLPTTNDWAFADWRVIGPAGGFVASELKIRVSTDWHPPPLGS